VATAATAHPTRSHGLPAVWYRWTYYVDWTLQ